LAPSFAGQVEVRLSRPVDKVASAPETERSEDYAFLQRLKFAAFDATLDSLEAKKVMVDRISRNMLQDDIAHALEVVLAVEGVTLSITQRRKLIEEIEYEVIGFGPLQPFLDDPTVDDIIVNGHRTIYVERKGELEQVPSGFRDDTHLMNIIQRIVSPVGRRVDESTPYGDARLPDGSRVNVIIPPIALDGPMLSIRKFREQPLRAKELIRLGSLTNEMLVYLASAVRSRLNVLICGGTGSGKTTLLNTLSSYISPKERVVTIEDTAEIRLQQCHVVRLETRPPSPDNPEAEITARDLMRNVLRMRPDRIILGEVRGNEAIDMLQAMGTGHHGSMATIHANSTRDALDRLELLIGLAEMRAEPRTLRRYISSIIHLIVQVQRMAGGRRITSIAEVAGVEGDTYVLNEMFRYVENGTDANSARFEQAGGLSYFASKIQMLDPKEL
jgi:pilus assembly protein CpaF